MAPVSGVVVSQTVRPIEATCDEGVRENQVRPVRSDEETPFLWGSPLRALKNRGGPVKIQPAAMRESPAEPYACRDLAAERLDGDFFTRAVSSSSRRIIVVDDHRDGADSLALLLEEAGHHVAAFYSTDRVLALAEVFRPHVVFLDLSLRGLTAFSLARQIREAAWGATTRLVATTGWVHPTPADLIRTEAFDECLLKPFDLLELERVVTAP